MIRFESAFIFSKRLPFVKPSRMALSIEWISREMSKADDMVSKDK
jgi:hypothetical protein